MKTCFLIINYNDFKTTSKLLKNISTYDFLDEILVVDNKSLDSSFDELKGLYHKNDKVSIVQTVENKGYAAGINYGCRYLIEKVGSCNIIVSNADIEIKSEEDLKSLINTKPEKCTVVAPIVREHQGLNRGWKIPRPIDDILLNIAFVHRYLRPLLLFYDESHYENSFAEVEVVSGCFFVIDSRELEKIEFFDENVFLYYEENILAFKLKLKGLKTYVNTNIEVYHNHSVSIDKSISTLNKFKILKQSQYYFHVRYNKVNFIEKTLLKLTNKTTYFLLFIKDKIQFN